MSVAGEIRPFRAETKELLRLMIDSLYTRKDIFLRELISNASDALDRLRFESLVDASLMENGERLEIRLDVDREARTLTISDNGIGMSREEVVDNIGTLGKSGTKEVRHRIQQLQAQPESEPGRLIGEFGVGFYSAFMVATKVRLVTRRAGERDATFWESDGSGTYEVGSTEKTNRGTSITLFLKAHDPDLGIEDYTDDLTLSRIVRQHSDFISYPIVMKRMEDDWENVGPDGGRAAKQAVPTDQTLNSMKPIWTRSPSDVRPEEYEEFYKHVTHDWSQPLKTIHFKAEGTFEYDALLFIPSTAPYDLYYVAPDIGLRLFSRRVMIVEKCEDLLPRYLRFIRGVVDSADLPLNVSRQRLQQDHHITLIRKRLTRKILDVLEDLFTKEHETYILFWRQFGRALKEGISSDREYKDRILTLSLFESSHHSTELTTLKEYVSRMPASQNQIFYMTGESRTLLETSPHVEALLKNGYEVLFMTEGVDELLLQHVREFDGKSLKSVGKGVLQLPGEEKDRDRSELGENAEKYRSLLAFLEKHLSSDVKQARLSTRLTKSPACLVVEDHEFSPTLQRVLHKGKKERMGQRRILELNPEHPLIMSLQERQMKNAEDPLLISAARLLYGLALLAEGSELPDAALFNTAATEVLTTAVAAST